MQKHSLQQAHVCGRAGFSLVEVSVSTLLVGLILVTALKCSGAAVRAFSETGNDQKAVLLAEDLMAEIVQQDYVEPEDVPEFGIEGSETNWNRNLWDDTDDYRAWKASPPREKDGTVIPHMVGWVRAVEVQHVDPDDFSSVLADGDDQGVKRITVEVTYNGVMLASLVSYQTEAWVAMIPDPGNTLTAGSAPPVNQPPVAVVSGSPVSGTETLEVSFDATASFDPEDQDLTYEWDFGDGEFGSGPMPTHTYTNYGPMTVVRTATLIVTDVYGAKDQDTMSITIYEGISGYGGGGDPDTDPGGGDPEMPPPMP